MGVSRARGTHRKGDLQGDFDWAAWYLEPYTGPPSVSPPTAAWQSKLGGSLLVVVAAAAGHHKTTSPTSTICPSRLSICTKFLRKQTETFCLLSRATCNISPAWRLCFQSVCQQDYAKNYLMDFHKNWWFVALMKEEFLFNMAEDIFLNIALEIVCWVSFWFVVMKWRKLTTYICVPHLCCN